MTRLRSFLLIPFFLLACGMARAQDYAQPVLDVYAKAYAENWVQFGGGFHQTYFYLPRTIRTTSRGTKTVWGVNVQSMSGADTAADLSTSRAAIVKSRGGTSQIAEKYTTYLLTKVLWEIDCVHQRARILKLLDYDEEGNIIWSSEVTRKMEEPVPDSNGESLVKAFCDPRHRNYFRDILEGRPAKR